MSSGVASSPLSPSAAMEFPFAEFDEVTEEDLGRPNFSLVSRIREWVGEVMGGEGVAWGRRGWYG